MRKLALRDILGFIAVIIYLIAGPDDSPRLPRRPPPPMRRPGICAAGAHRQDPDRCHAAGERKDHHDRPILADGM
jgi:hypothetical protein